MFSSMTQTSLFAAVLAMASTTSAHMFIQSPVPFAGVSKSPLDPSGSNFPCQGSSYQITTMNDWSVGSEVTVSFPSDQTATHGGGSCQISVTKDEKPTKDSKWKVIHSIEGGCPTTGAGNNGPLGTFGFKVPSSLPDGQLTMAWTWFNKVGNREMYMNCAPIKVSGGSGKGFDSLPDMAIANINAGGSTCKTTEGADYTFANPGESVVKLTKGPFKELCGGAASDSGSTGSSGSAAGSGNTGSSGSTGTSGGSSSGSGSGSAPAASASPATPAASAAPVASAAPAAPAASAAPAAPQAPATGGSASGGSTCSENGAILCNGESQFGICNNGGIVYQPVAAGTKCSNGAITRRDLHRNARTVIPLF